MNKKMLIAGLAIVLLVGIVSAAVIEWFGAVEMTATVNQAVLVDGQSYPTVIEDTEIVAGGESFCRPHWLESQTSVPVRLQFETTFSPELTDNEIVVTYSVETTDDGGIFGSRSNEVVGIPVDLTLDEIFAGDGLQYTYTVLDGGVYDGAAPIIAVLTLENGWRVVLFPGWGARTGTHTLTFNDTTAYDTGGNHYVDFVVYRDIFGDQLNRWSSKPSYPGWTATKALPGCPVTGSEKVTRIAIQHQAANTGQRDRLVSLSFAGKSYSFVIEEAQPFTLPPGATLNFYICYKFDLLIQADTYTITTEVKPAP